MTYQHLRIYQICCDSNLLSSSCYLFASLLTSFPCPPLSLLFTLCLILSNQALLQGTLKMPVTTTRRSQSPTDLRHTGLDYQKLATPLNLHRRRGYGRRASVSTISSATSTFSSIIDEPPHFATPVPKLPFNDVEAWTLYDFECHARCCPACQDLYHYHLTTSQVCYTGHNLAQKVVNLAYSKTTSPQVSDNSTTKRFVIPAGHVYVKDLLLAVDDKVRRRRMLAESRMSRQGYSSFDRTYDVKSRTPFPHASTAITDKNINEPVDDDEHNRQERLPSLEMERPKTRGKPSTENEPSPAEKTLGASRRRASNTKYTSGAEFTRSTSPSPRPTLSPPTSRSWRGEAEAKTTPMPPSSKTSEAEAKRSGSRGRSKNRSQVPPPPKRTIRWSWFLT